MKLPITRVLAMATGVFLLAQGVAIAQGQAAPTAPQTPQMPTAPQIVPCDWAKPVNLSSSPVAQALFQVLQWLLPIVGGFLIVLAGYQTIVTIGHGITASKKLQHAGTMIPADAASTPVATRLLEIFVGIFLLSVSLSGQWVSLINGTLNLALSVIHSVARALGAAC